MADREIDTEWTNKTRTVNLRGIQLSEYLGLQMRVLSCEAGTRSEFVVWGFGLPWLFVRGQLAGASVRIRYV